MVFGYYLFAAVGDFRYLSRTSIKDTLNEVCGMFNSSFRVCSDVGSYIKII